MQEENFPYIDRLDETVLDEAILRFGTPTYVFDVEQAKKRARAFRGIIGQAADLCYAMKANPFLVEPWQRKSIALSVFHGRIPHL